MDVASLPEQTLQFAHRMFDAARSGDDVLLLQAVDAGLPVNLTNDKGVFCIVQSLFVHPGPFLS
jgi:hypothetical protein